MCLETRRSTGERFRRQRSTINWTMFALRKWPGKLFSLAVALAELGFSAVADVPINLIMFSITLTLNILWGRNLRLQKKWNLLDPFFDPLGNNVHLWIWTIWTPTRYFSHIVAYHRRAPSKTVVAAISSTHVRSFSSRAKKNAASKSTKRLIESQQIAEKRQAATKKYQHAVKQRSDADEKKVLDQIEKVTVEDRNVLPSYDLWNQQDAKKGTLKDKSNCRDALILIRRESSCSGRPWLGCVHRASVSNLRLESARSHHQKTDEVTSDWEASARHIVQSNLRWSSSKSRWDSIETRRFSLIPLGATS